MKHFLFLVATLFLNTPFATAQWINPSPENTDSPAGIDLMPDTVAFPVFKSLGRLEYGVLEDSLGNWPTIGASRLNFPPSQPDYYGFFANDAGESAFFSPAYYAAAIELFRAIPEDCAGCVTADPDLPALPVTGQ